jgi:hypothetical protein
MKIELTFKTVIEVNTDDYDEAEALAKIKAYAIMISVKESTGYKFGYKGMSIGPAIEESITKFKSLLQ